MSALLLFQCYGCKKPFKSYKSKSTKYCSRSCYSGENHPRWKGGPRTKVCGYCGESFSFEVKKRKWTTLAAFQSAEFCSVRCRKAGFVCETNPTEAGTPRRKHRGGHAAWARAVISRDRATCQYCGAVGVEMHAHHLKSYKDHPELRWATSNGQTLCYRCHWNTFSGSKANGVNSGKPAAGNAGGNPEPSFGRKPVEGVTTKGRAYRRWEGECSECGAFLSKRWSDAVNKPHIYCDKSCMMQHRWKLIPDKLKTPKAVIPSRAPCPKGMI